MSQLLDKEIEAIVETYKTLGSIEKTAKETGYGPKICEAPIFT